MAETPQPATETARVAAELMDMARVICAHRRRSDGKRMKLTDYLDSLLRGPITRDHKAVLKQLTDQQK